MKDKLSVDALAQEIRRVDGNHSLGAGALADALMPFITSILDAEGDGGAVAWIEPKVIEAMQGDAEFDGMDGVECVVLKARGDEHTMPLYTHPARSGVVSDEDVEAACRVNYESDGNSKWDKLAECWKVKHRTAMRAALEHFAMVTP